jgi:YHS domain-containing protein
VACEYSSSLIDSAGSQKVVSVGGKNNDSIRTGEVLMAVDPVCGIHVDERAAVPTEQYTSRYEGETLYFCSQGCKEAFDGNPEQYVKKSA